MRRLRAFLLAVLLGPLSFALPAAAQDSPDAALDRLLRETRATLPGVCSDAQADKLVRVLCAGKLRAGVRDFYPLFASMQNGERRGYEIDVMRALVAKLGVDLEQVRVNAATRIPFLAEDRIDLAIATMGHNSQRDSQVRFIRPHYYQSETILVGPRNLPVTDWKDVGGRTICVTVGNVSNAQIVEQNVRLMLFDEAGVLPDRLKNETCTFAAQDDSFFAAYFIDAEFERRFEPKFGFAQLPWGMAVARDRTAQLGRALDLISQIFHRDGVFLEAARKNRIGTTFLEKQRATWQQPRCNAARPDAGCVLPPLSTTVHATSFAPSVVAFEKWLDERAGITIQLPMLKTVPAWRMFLDGARNSLILIAGALAATLVFAVLLGAAMGSSSVLLRWPARALTVTFQSTPVVLILVIAAALAHAMFVYSDVVVLTASIVALGLFNGGNAGQAIAEALTSLRAERGEHKGLFAEALGRAATQIVAFLINAAKGTPIASFIGAPELLSVITDITSFSSGRATTYTLVLVYYVLVVMVVVWLCERLRVALERRAA
jgi:polar amino acid transport system substrate-binding protein